VRLVRSRAVNPCIITGDFNMEPDNPALSLLSGFQDVMAGSTEPTFHGWDSLQSRIDYIFASPDVSFAEPKVHPDVISDHFAISALVSLTPPAAP
jgi:endonuclease/exonuclease/phosphatase family metal-dependent hydrolase